jgi:threonine dehydratase
MRLPNIQGVRLALDQIRPYLPETPLVRSELLSQAFDADVWLKNETVAPIGCFKLRGALTDISRTFHDGGRRPLVTSSSGNHGQGVAYAGRLLDLPVTVFLPDGANAVKAAMIALLGAKIRSVPSDSFGTKAMAQRYAQDNGHYFVDDGSSVDLAEGAGTVGLEIAERLGDIAATFIPVGDAALIGGSACALKAAMPGTEIIGVQAEQAPAYALSRQSGRIVEHAPDTIADGLATRAPAPFALAAMMALVDRFVLVSEPELLAAVHTLAVAGHLLAEPSGAATLAAAWKDRTPWRGKRIVLIVTGANVDSRTLRDALNSEPLWCLPGIAKAEQVDA